MIQTYRLQGWGPNPPILEVPPPLSVPNFALANILARFDSVSLTTVAQSLMERVDTKFLLSLPTLEVLLPELVDSYAVLDIEGRRIFDYDNLYLDTSNLDFYHLHQRGAYSRFKVRYRHYRQTVDTFLELKAKTPKRRTIKERRPVSHTCEASADSQTSFLANYLPKSYLQLVPSLRVHYQRISLVSKVDEERLTLDIKLQFAHPQYGKTEGLNRTVIAELKQPKYSYTSPFIELVRKHHLKEISFSKYCMGCCYLQPGLKQNRFKPTLLATERLESC